MKSGFIVLLLSVVLASFSLLALWVTQAIFLQRQANGYFIQNQQDFYQAEKALSYLEHHPTQCLKPTRAADFYWQAKNTRAACKLTLHPQNFYYLTEALDYQSCMQATTALQPGVQFYRISLWQHPIALQSVIAIAKPQPQSNPCQTITLIKTGRQSWREF